MTFLNTEEYMDYKLIPTFKFFIRNEVKYVLYNETLYIITDRYTRHAEYTKIKQLTEVSEAYFEIQFGFTRDMIMRQRCHSPWWHLIEGRAHYAFPLGRNPDVFGWIRHCYYHHKARFLKYVLRQDIDLELHDYLISRF